MGIVTEDVGGTRNSLVALSGVLGVHALTGPLLGLRELHSQIPWPLVLPLCIRRISRVVAASHFLGLQTWHSPLARWQGLLGKPA